MLIIYPYGLRSVNRSTRPPLPSSYKDLPAKLRVILIGRYNRAVSPYASISHLPLLSKAIIPLISCGILIMLGSPFFLSIFSFERRNIKYCII